LPSAAVPSAIAVNVAAPAVAASSVGDWFSIACAMVDDFLL
jgi:hypothetical protein